MKYFRSHEYYASAAWRGTWAMDGGGALMNQGIHGVDVFRHLMGPVRSVHALTRTLTRRIEVEDSAAAVLEFENGAIANVIITYDVWDSHLPRIEIFGSEGTLSACEADPLAGPDIFGGEIEYRSAEKSDWLGFPDPIPRHAPTPWEKIETLYPYNENSRGVGLAEMVYSIQTGKKNRTLGEMALHVLEIGYGIHESAASGQYYQMETTFERPDGMSPYIEAFSDKF